ncbi:hypothetical protein K501DRAFT_287882 [Backusella circina FSU 941]|nr:hypothetical protein K501DRAFT_287882 [Backusella circina FSU 941]
MDAIISFDNDFLMDDYYVDDITHSSIPSNNANIASPIVTQTTNNKRKLQDSMLNTYELKPAKRRTNKRSATQNTQKHECLLCGMHFTRRYNLSSHMKTHDANRFKPFPCKLCNKQFDRKHDLARHVSTVHNGERAFNCSQCNCTFSRKDALNRHVSKKHTMPVT